MRTTTIFCIVFLLLNGITALAQVGVHTDFPDNSSAMDIVATNRGLLIPRVTLTSDLNSPNPITAPAVGLLVFNSGANQPVGFYYWTGTAWVMISTGSPGGNFWSITGNAGTIPGTNFLGTTDNNHFLIYSNNTERMRFESDGQVIIGNTVPVSGADAFTVYGNPTQNYAIAAYSPTVGFYSSGGRYGIYTILDSACTPSPGFAVLAKNSDVSGYAIYAVGSNVSSLPLITNHTAGIACYGFDGLHAWGRNATTGLGICAIGSGLNSSFALGGVSAGLSAVGNYGIIARGSAATGRGIVAIGSGGASPSTSNESEGGAFTGYHGVYAKGVNASGIGVIGVGSNSGSYSTVAGGVGGSFSGNYGAYGKGLAADGVGVLGLGSGGGGYYTVTGGSGGAFTGNHGSLSVGVDITLGTGVLGAGNNGSYIILPSGSGGSFTGVNTGAAGFGTDASAGIGIIGAGNNQAAWVPSNGCGGAFTGNSGVFCRSSNATGTGIFSAGNNIASPLIFTGGSGGAFTGTEAGAVGWGTTAATGTGIIGTGNNIATPLTYANGSGGAFTGTAAGVVAYGTTAASGIGVIGAGNNLAPTIPAANGCGGAFTGTICGVYGNATATGGTRYGGYFATTNGQYAYVGGRVNNTNKKIVGTGDVSSIVKNTNGELVTLTCPESPESLFQDYGIGQLENGVAHITIDPDLAININVSEEHPLKVYITPEGDCNGVYVTNKSANGFDVIELQGGTSNIPFSWQIVATRANEEYVLKDGSREVSDYSRRFAPAPGPLETFEQPAIINQVSPMDSHALGMVRSGKDTYKSSQDHTGEIMEVKEDEVIVPADNQDE